MRVSVALGTDNDASRLGPLLDSLTEQKHAPDELIVFDDRSRDGTPALLDAFARRAAFPVVIHANERRLGPVANASVAIEACTGDLIAVAQASDRWYPDRLTKAAGAFSDDPQIGLIYSDADVEPHLGRSLWDAVGLTEQRRRDGGLLPLVVVHDLLSAATVTMLRDLRELILPIPEHVSLDRWVAVLGLLVRPYVLLDEPVLFHRGRGGEAPRAVMPDEHGSARWKTRLTGVGAKVAAGEADLHRQRRRADATAYESLLERFASAGPSYLERHGLSPQPLAEQTLADLRGRSRHLRARGELPDQRRRRLPAIVRELRSGRYNRYSAGALSALQDLAY